MPNFTPVGATRRPWGGGEKSENWPLSYLNPGALRFAQCCR